GGRLGEVPDAAGCVLAVPVGRALREPAAQVEPVLDDDAGDALDLLRLAGDRHYVARALSVLDPGVDVAGARFEREPLVVDARAEARGPRHRRRSARTGRAGDGRERCGGAERRTGRGERAEG